MTNINQIILVFCIILIVIAIINQTENMINIPRLRTAPKWRNDKKCKYKMLKIYQDILEKHHIQKTDNENDWIIYFPCSYTNNKKELARLNANHKNQLPYGSGLLLLPYGNVSVSSSCPYHHLHNVFSRVPIPF